ncbi:sulfurtransferase complex subunit TusB [Actinobacillus vicugnae]|uniref:sulfurtransferase complex subunit TusB n=1 Tax=Actinobacillus vicugnae TaxID=2573093 RepID=UPI001240B196|nr:sulfurtransferase complex subunit TusB [Actinobacillus vicugnae]
MLYTLSKAQYDQNELQTLLAQITENDAIILWQDGVLQAVKFPQFFTHISNLFVLENDLNARGLRTHFNTITLTELVKITEKFHPQVAF